MQHELRCAGRTRGREDVAGGVGRGVVGADRRARQQAIERHPPQPLDSGRRRRRLLADHDDRRERVERRRVDLGEDRQEVDLPEARRAGQHLGAGAADDVGDLDRAVARVHRDGDGAQPRAGEIENRIGRHVGQPQRHAIARSDAEIGEALRRARRLSCSSAKEIVRSPCRKAGAWVSPRPSRRAGVQTSAAGWSSGMARGD